MAPKERHVVSYGKMSQHPDLVAAFTEKYPKGSNDYMDDLVKYPRADGTCFYAVTVETDRAVYLVKIDVKTDDPDDVNRWLEEGEDEGREGDAGAEGADGGDAASDVSDAVEEDSASEE